MDILIKNIICLEYNQLSLLENSNKTIKLLSLQPFRTPIIK